MVHTHTHIHSGVARFTSTRIRCRDKAAVYKAMLETVLTDSKGQWSVDERSGEAWSQVLS